jgi:hypothetical protein
MEEFLVVKSMLITLFVLEVVAMSCHIWLSFEAVEAVKNNRQVSLAVYLGLALGWGKNLEIALISSSGFPHDLLLLPPLVVFSSLCIHNFSLYPLYSLKDIDNCKTDRWLVRAGLFVSIFITITVRMFWLNVLLTTR